MKTKTLSLDTIPSDWQTRNDFLVFYVKIKGKVVRFAESARSKKEYHLKDSSYFRLVNNYAVYEHA